MTEIEIGRHVLQPHRQLLLDGEHVHLGPRALQILSILAEADGEIVTKDELMQAVWGDVTVEENALQVHVTALRKALGADADRLHTIRGIGYQLDLGDDGTENASEQLDNANDRTARVDKRRNRLLPAAILISAIAVALAAWSVTGLDRSPSVQDQIPILVQSLEPIDQSSETFALASGMTDELIVRLRRAPELLVGTYSTAGTSERFNETYRVEGSVRHNENDLRVTARLLDPDGEVLWSQSFDRTLGDLFDVQEEVAASIAEALSVSFDIGVNADVTP